MARNDSDSPSGDSPLESGVVERLFSSLYEDDAECLAEAGLTRIGDYLLDCQLGTGGGGAVYQGVKLGTQRTVTVKLLRRPLGEGKAAQRAWRELDVLEQLRCPAVPRLHEHGMHGGQLFLAYDHIDGVPLDEYCESNTLNRRARVTLLVKVARALQSVHERGFLHRDIKPANILVDAEGRPYLIDLGLATLIDADPQTSLTDEGQPVGSLATMAPEQARGHRSEISTRTDIYSLAATACFILTGKTPHDTDAELPEVIRRVGQDPPRDSRHLDPTLPKPLVAILDRALAPRHEDRFSSVSDFADDLERWLDGRPVESQPPSWWRNRRLAIKRHPARWAWGAAASAAITGLAVFGMVGHVQAYQALESQVKAEYAVDQLELQKTDLERTLAEEGAKLDRIMGLSPAWSATVVTTFEDEDYRSAFGMLTLLTAAIELGYPDPDQLFDTEEVRMVLADRDIRFNENELAEMLAQLEFSERPMNLLIHRVVESVFPDEPDMPDRMMAWLRAVIDIEGLLDEEILDEIEERLRDLYRGGGENRPTQLPHSGSCRAPNVVFLSSSLSSRALRRFRSTAPGGTAVGTGRVSGSARPVPPSLYAGRLAAAAAARP